VAETIAPIQQARQQGLACREMNEPQSINDLGFCVEADGTPWRLQMLALHMVDHHLPIGR